MGNALGILFAIIVLALFFQFIWLAITNGGRKWYPYNPNKPWKGGYYEPLLPSTPPYNEYKWNPRTCRFEHKKTGAPLYPWQKPYTPEGWGDTHQGVRVLSKEEWDWEKLCVPEEKQSIFLDPTLSTRKKQRPEWLRFLLEENLGTLIEKRRQRKLEEHRKRVQ